MRSHANSDVGPKLRLHSEPAPKDDKVSLRGAETELTELATEAESGEDREQRGDLKEKGENRGERRRASSTGLEPRMKLLSNSSPFDSESLTHR